MKQTRIKQSQGISLNTFIAILIFVPCFALFLYRISLSEKNLIPLSVVALIAGTIIEHRRISGNWTETLWTACGAFFLSFSAFLPGKRERNYSFDNHAEIWPYVFLLIFVLGAITFYRKKVTAGLTEGVTLIQSIAIIYWVIERGFTQPDNLFIFMFLCVSGLSVFFSLIHALTYLRISRRSRLLLSIWSSIMMIILAVDNILRIYSNELIETISSLEEKLYVGFQYFALGVCSIYIAHNALMLIEFLPGKGTFFNKAYFENIRDLKEEHISRYSGKQVKIFHSVLCILLLSALFLANYLYKFIPYHLMIWVVFIFFPYILNTIDKVISPKPAEK